MRRRLEQARGALCKGLLSRKARSRHRRRANPQPPITPLLTRRPALAPVLPASSLTHLRRRPPAPDRRPHVSTRECALTPARPLSAGFSQPQMPPRRVARRAAAPRPQRSVWSSAPVAVLVAVGGWVMLQAYSSAGTAPEWRVASKVFERRIQPYHGGSRKDGQEGMKTVICLTYRHTFTCDSETCNWRLVRAPPRPPPTTHTPFTRPCSPAASAPSGYGRQNSASGL